MIDRAAAKSATFTAVLVLGASTASAVTAVTNVAATATVVSISSFLDFSGATGGAVTVNPGGLAVAENNLLTGALDSYTSNSETRYIFGESDQSPSVTIKLAQATSQLRHFGATWYDAAYSDRAPSDVTVEVSSDGVAFTTVGSYIVSGATSGGSTLINLAAPVSGQYVRYTFGVPGQVNAGNAVAIASVTATVPEPAAWGMMITGFGFVGLGARRRRGLAAA